MQKIMSLTLAVLFVSILSGCAMVGEIFNPYKSEFSCPLSEKGKCVDLKQAYKESVAKKPGDISNELILDKKKEKTVANPGEHTAGPPLSENLYQESVYKKLSNLIEQPVTPMVVPPKVMRALLLPYKGEGNELYFYRYVYFFADDAKWVLSESGIRGEE